MPTFSSSVSGCPVLGVERALNARSLGVGGLVLLYVSGIGRESPSFDLSSAFFSVLMVNLKARGV